MEAPGLCQKRIKQWKGLCTAPFSSLWLILGIDLFLLFHNLNITAVDLFLLPKDIISLSRVRQVKESGLRKLQIGKARRESPEKLDITDSGLYRGGLDQYREHDFVSNVEHIAIERISAEERYEHMNSI